MVYTVLDPDDEGYMALMIAVVLGKNVETSFRILYEGEEKRYRNGWTDEDYENIDVMRQQGIKWKTIGEMYGVQASTIHQAHKRWLRGGAK